ncbi:MAG: carbamoyl-phosphate synthase large subunit [Planctomycetota bacterium]
MPKRTDLSTILIIGSGPIVIGQGCEFDYSGTQACKALREEGYRVVLINSNPATIMTDPEFADSTYIEPITPEAVEKIIVKHKGTDLHIDAVLPTLGGQTALNCACTLDEQGVFAKHDVEMIGANREVIYRAEDRLQFKEIMESIGLQSPKSGVANTMDEAWGVLEETGLPSIIRPAFTLGGTGGGVAYNREEFEDIVRRGLDASMTSQVLIDQSLLGWKEYEMEVMRDRDDNAVIICAIENFDAMGVHTGDSITVAPAQTLTDKEYQRMRDASLAILRAVGVETGGSNCQFAINPANGDMVVVEMNPRVSRSSALASKATGFPIAKIAAKLAVGYTLWELPNDITGQTVACFEPSIDYVVTKIPRWTFEKFPEADETLTTQMKSVGEAMSIGRTFKESMQKGIRSMEVKRFGYGLDANDKWLNHQRGVENADGSKVEFPIDQGKLVRKLEVPSQGRWFYVRYAFKMGWSVEQVYDATKIDPWFLDQLKQLVDFEDRLACFGKIEDVSREVLFEAKQLGYSDAQLANLYLGAVNTASIMTVRKHRQSLGVEPVYKLVDTCAAEFEAVTPYYYSTYETPVSTVAADGSLNAAVDDEIRVTNKKKIVILGGGPNRIGQGIEFDYCCVQAAFAAQELGFEAVMVNSNPETVSTDYDTSDLLFFEPLTLEDVLNICERLNGHPFGEDASGEGLLHGVIVQFGGQTPLNLADGLRTAGVPIIGTSVDSIDLAEDRDKFAALCDRLGVKQPPNGIAYDVEQAIEIANRITYPVLVRPSFVLGGRAMETVFDDDQLRHYMAIAIGASDLAGQPILVDKFLAEATECDIDVIADFGGDDPRALVCGVLEHIEEAGIHSGDSACTIPPYSLTPEIIAELKDQSRKMAEALGVRGLMNVQWAVKDGEVYVIEVNPRASRTVPFVGKATGVSWARIAAKVMAGRQLTELGVTEEVTPTHTSIKESVFPFGKFPGVDVILGPEMRSTGECMGADADFPVAFAKAQMAAGSKLPLEGKVFLSVRESDKPAVVEVARGLVAQGFEVVTTRGTHAYLIEHGIETTRIKKIQEGGRPNALDLMKNGELDLIINTPTRKGAGTDEGKLRATAVRNGVTMITTMTAAKVAVQAIEALRRDDWTVKPLQEYFPATRR